MYKIIGADQKEYGPVSAEQLRQWISQGRVGAQTLAQAEGATEWRAISAFPEFADVLAARAGGAAAAPGADGPTGLPADLLTRDYDLDIGGCISGGWNLLKNNFGIVFGGCAIFLLIQIAMSALGNIPLIGLFITLGSLLIAGPLTAGVYFLLLKCIRRQPAEVGDVFSGFRLAFGHLLAGYLVPTIFTCLAALPGAGLMGYAIFMMVHNHAPDALHVMLASLGFVAAFIPATYLSVSWMFTLPLVIDKGLDFLPAMGTSRKMVGKHWWLVFGLLIVCGLVNIAGMLACCVGLFFSMPIVFAALMYAYETIFSASVSQTS